MSLWFYGTEPHFIRRLGPVAAAVADYEWFACPPRLADYARSLGVERIRWKMPPHSGSVVVASGGDMKRMARRRVALMEHGAGQTYVRPHASYAGGPGRERVGLFLCQSDRVAAANEDAWPGRRYPVVGDPALDGVHAAVRSTVSDVPTVGLAFHWDCPVVPETRSAWRHYRDLSTLLDVARAEGWRIVGHGHPRIIDSHLRGWYRSLDVEVVDDADEVLSTADVLAVDNSSIMYEAATAGVRVVALNAPWYRRDVHHGLRFWDLVPGPQVDGPDELPTAIADVLAGTWDDRRERIASRVYANRDGSAAEAAAAAIVGWAEDGYPIGGPMPEADRTAHDPYAPKSTSRPRRRHGGPGPSYGDAVGPTRRGPSGETTADEPADPADVEQGEVEEVDAQKVPENAHAVIDWIDAAEDDLSEKMRARAAWDIERERDADDRRVTVVRRVAKVLDDVDSDE